jgi:hypothetical protein
MRRALVILCGSILATVLAAGPALACGGLVSPNGTIALVRTTTMAAYHDGIEHYVTGFQFAGAGGEFGSIVPLPGIPTRVVKGGDWTLQRLEQEVNPPPLERVAFAAAPVSEDVVVLERKQIDALDVTILKGGGFAVGRWATDHGFQLTPDAPELLDFYAQRSPIFMAVKFNAKRVNERPQGLQRGDAIPVHLVIPTSRPWVPLRILALGARASQPIDADVFLLTDRAPALLPVPGGAPDFGPAAPGLNLQRVELASAALLRDLRSDRGMQWLPTSGMWLSYLQLRARASDLTYDLAIDPSGNARPSPVDAGLTVPGRSALPNEGQSLLGLWVALGAIGVVFAVAAGQRRGMRVAL